MQKDSLFYIFTVKSLLAGMLIGLGCVAYVASPVKYVGSFLFSLGLLTIMVKSYFLYTGKIGDWTLQSTLRLVYMFVLNGLACAATAWIFTHTRIDLGNAAHVAELKLNDTMLSSFILAAGCGAMMHIAYYGYTRGKHPLYVIMPVMFFMLAGFEHSVANCGFFAMAGVDMTATDWSRLALIALGNAVGALVFTRLLSDPQAHAVPPLFESDLKYDPHHSKSHGNCHTPAGTATVYTADSSSSGNSNQAEGHYGSPAAAAAMAMAALTTSAVPVQNSAMSDVQSASVVHQNQSTGSGRTQERI